MVEMEGLVFDRTGLERRPTLTAEQAPRDRLQVAFVGIFEDDDATRPCNPRELGQHRLRVAEVVEDSNAYGCVEMAVGVGQVAGIAQDDLEPRLSAEGFPGRGHVNLGRIEKHDFVVTGVFVGQSAETCPDLEQPRATGRQQRANRYSIAGVLVLPG